MDADKRDKTNPGKRWKSAERFQNKTTILWNMIASGHFALCKVDVTECEIQIYDSIKSTKWNTVKLKAFLKSIFGVAFADYTGQQQSRQQKNNNDCGVYTMANLRRIVEGKDLRHERMFGDHQKDATRENKVVRMREQMTRELKKQKLEAWK
jgi:Ulp1 family protease